jgi:hypothetical protein
MEIHGEETKRTAKEAMDRWYKAGFRETRDIKLGRKGTKSVRVERVVGGGKNSRRVVMPMMMVLLVSSFTD